MKAPRMPRRVALTAAAAAVLGLAGCAGMGPRPQPDVQAKMQRVGHVVVIYAENMVKRGFIDRSTYDTTSILKFITERFGLEPLPGVRRNMGDLVNALQ